MSYTLNGRDIAEARLTFPLTGAWHVDVVVDTQEDITGAAVLDFDGALSLTGTVISGGLFLETGYVRVLAGSGGWIAPMSPTYYQGSTLGTVLSDLLRKGGDALSSTADASVRRIQIPAFAATTGTVGANVRALMKYAPTASWRFLPDGTFWVGSETWPAFGEDYQVTTESPIERRLDLGALHPVVRAGQSVVKIDGSTINVNRVESVISAESLRARVWWQ